MTTMAPAPGEVIGDYEILDRIGGNMGLVFKARHRLLDKVVALKLVPSDRIADPARLTRFQREMRAMGQLEHQNLVTAADARSVGDWHLVAMELIDGVDLQQLVRIQGPLPVAAACEIARQAAQGLQYAHEHGLIHRDIKPSNLMLTRAGTVKVIDMGLALIRDDSTAQLTQTGLVLGTMSYCAPEQFRDASHVDIRADIYSLGCTLYHLLTGKSPYWQRKTITEVMQAHLHERFPSLAEALPDAPAGLEAVLARMTAKDREARFSTPSEVVAALEPFARGADLGPLVPAMTQQSPSHRVTAGKAPPTPEGRRLAGGGERQPKARLSRRAALLIGVPTAAGGAFLLRKLVTPKEPTKEEKLHKWQVLYDLLDDKLACFMGYVGRGSPSTKFLIYSRGTDKNWVTAGFQAQWVTEIEARFPELKGRISTMTITLPPGRERITFENLETADEMKKTIKLTLGLPDPSPTPTPPGSPDSRVLVLMDTTADRGVYDEENKGKGITNAEVLQKHLQKHFNRIYAVHISIESSKRDWQGEQRVLGYKPSLVIFHRSAFFHPVNAELGLGYPPF